MKINAPFVERILTKFISEELAKFHFTKGILGISGGIDSSVCACLAARALGPGHVIGLIMPYGTTYSNDADDARQLIKALKIKSKTIDISPMIDAYFNKFPTKNKISIGNKMARERMSILYDHSEKEKALILGTSNKTELLLGYGTIHGDMACAINPLGDLYKSQVRQLAAHLELPEIILNKAPTAGLWEGQTDEKELGLPYEEIDKILYALVDKRLRPEQVISSGFSRDKVQKIINLIKSSEFKRNLPPIPKISERSVGHDFLYPYDRDR